MIVVAWIILALAVDPSGPPVQVTGATTCPAPAEVQTALAGLISPKDPDAAADVAQLTDDAGAVVVTLRRAAGDPIGDKRLDPGLSCPERARAAAVIIAAWETRPAAQTTALVVPPPPRPVEVVAPSQPPAMTGPAWPPARLEPGVSVGGSINGTTLAPSATIEAAYVRPFSQVVPVVSALFVGSHTTGVGAGTASWRRYGLMATAGTRRDWAPLFAEARIGVALTVLDISGSSFPRNGSGFTFDPGVQIGARFGLRTKPPRLRWWIDAAIAFWPREQEVYVQGAPGSAVLPRGGALLSLGASYEGG